MTFLVELRVREFTTSFTAVSGHRSHPTTRHGEIKHAIYQQGGGFDPSPFAGLLRVGFGSKIHMVRPNQGQRMHTGSVNL